MVMMRQVVLLFPELADSISFFNWLSFALPLAALFIVVLWLCYIYLYCPTSGEQEYLKIDTKQLR